MMTLWNAKVTVLKSLPVRADTPELNAVLIEYDFAIGSERVTPTRELSTRLDGTPSWRRCGTQVVSPER